MKMSYSRSKISDDSKFNAACNHYKDTYEIHARTLHQRNLTFLLTLIVAVTFALQIPYSALVHEAIHSLISNSPAKIKIPIGGNFLISMMWALLLGTSIRYFQLSLQVERQYEYLHLLEYDLKKYFSGTRFFTREGTSYLNNYPLYSNWIWLLYSTVFPTLLLIVTGLHIKSEIESTELISRIAVDIVCCTLICVTTILYLIRIHFGKKNESI